MNILFTVGESSSKTQQSSSGGQGSFCLTLALQICLTIDYNLKVMAIKQALPHLRST